MPPTFELGPWLALTGLGAFHGLNPAMGWLFAVALGLHRTSRRAVWLSLVPIALGHATSIVVVLAVVLALGPIVDRDRIEVLAGTVLLTWAAYHAIYGHRSRFRVGMLTGRLGLGLWSFTMAGAHGAGFMSDLLRCLVLGYELSIEGRAERDRSAPSFRRRSAR